MLKNWTKLTIANVNTNSTTLANPISGSTVSSSVSTASECESSIKPRKKLSFKEPDTIFNHLKLRKPFVRAKTTSIQPVRSASIDINLDENPFEEENDELEELEVNRRVKLFRRT